MRRLLIALAATTAFIVPAAAQEPVTVAVTAIVEHPALDAVRDGVLAALNDAGYAGDRLNFVYQSAQGDASLTVQIANEFVGMRPDVIVPISTPSAQAVVSATQDIPVVFSAVTDPVAAQLVSDMEMPGGNVTGLSDFSPIADQLALIREITPEARTIGVLYNPGEANSVALLNAVRDIGATMDFDVVEGTATNTADVQQAARSLIGRVDVIYVPTDNTVVSAFEAVAGVADEADIPLYAGDTASVERGAVAALGFNYYDVGVQTGEIVVRVLMGEDPGAIPVRVAQGTDLVVNPAAAEAQGVMLPQAVIDRASNVVGQ